MSKTSLLILALPLLFFACRKDAAGSLKETDLLPYGIPVSIMAPDSTDIKARDLAGVYRDVTVKGPGNYSVQVLSSTAEDSNLPRIKAEQLADVKANRYFKRIVREEENGFLYETALDSSFTNYGFRYIVLQGDLEIIFQTGLVGQFTQEEAEGMWEAVRQR
ncbi:MAG: hypothetical protein H6564_07885 [Lewinellaceae bacterium]|nr:hypothetical protein [Lewinellaceae bacterium]